MSSIDASSRAGATVTSARSAAGGASSAAPWLISSSRARSVSASAFVRYARRPALRPPPASRILSSASRKTLPNRAHGVDRLDVAQREALGGSPQEATLHPQDAAFNPPSCYQPRDDADHEDYGGGRGGQGRRSDPRRCSGAGSAARRRSRSPLAPLSRAARAGAAAARSLPSPPPPDARPRRAPAGGGQGRVARSQPHRVRLAQRGQLVA